MFPSGFEKFKLYQRFSVHVLFRLSPRPMHLNRVDDIYMVHWCHEEVPCRSFQGSSVAGLDVFPLAITYIRKPHWGCIADHRPT